MKNFFFLALHLLLIFSVKAQSLVYTASNFASVGDTFYLTRASVDTSDFISTGSSFFWDFSGLTGVSQSREVFGNPTQTGFSALQWPFLFNSNNTNLAYTNGKSTGIPSLGITFSDPWSYLKKSNSDLRQTASSYRVQTENLSLGVKNQFSSADVEYRFPILFGNEDSSSASFTTSIPATYYQFQTLKRKNKVDGTGTVVTPYGTFTHSLRIVSEIVQFDSIAILGNGLPAINRHFRELKWLDASKKYPVLIVIQNKVGNAWVTSSVDYLDVKTDFQTQALFSYSPAAPIQGDTVGFQNLSQNAGSYVWNFGDPSSGPANSSTDIHPRHIFSVPGTYPVQLIASNASFSDTLILPVFVNSSTVPVADFSFTTTSESCRQIQFTNASSDAESYFWNFGDTLSDVNSSISENPTHRFTLPGTYEVRLVASRGTLRDTLTKTITITPNLTVSVQISANSLVVQPGTSAVFTAQVTNGGGSPVFQWEKNGAPVGSDQNTFTDPAPSVGSQVRCRVFGSNPCGIEGEVLSNVLTYVSSTPTSVETPVISPSAGTYADPITVTLSCSTSGAKIYYTTSGNNPVVGTGYTKEYTAPFTMQSSGTVRAMAVFTGLPNSAIATANYTITNPGIVATPVISPATGTYQGMQLVTISCSTSGASVYYTTNGNLPEIAVPNSYTKLYTGPFSINATTTVKAVGVKSGIQNSVYATSVITIQNPSATVATPVISPGTGSYPASQTVTITCGTPGATIYYTTSGNVPVVGTGFTKLYTGSFTLNSSATVRAMASLSGSVNSAVAVSFITIGPAREAFSSRDVQNPVNPEARVFPNPFHDRFSVSVEGESVEFMLMDLQGRRINRLQVLSGGDGIHLLETPGLSPGMYLLRVSTRSGMQTLRIRKD